MRASIVHEGMHGRGMELSKENKCEPKAGGRANSNDSGPVVYFIYNEDFGVTAYGVANQPVSTKDERLSVASQMILEGQRGLLSAGR